MDAFAKLREQARVRRDAAFAIARAEYRQALRNVRTLERDDEGDDRPSRCVQSRILEVMPSRPFSTYEMAVWLLEDEPQEPVCLATVSTALSSIAQRGLLERAGKDIDGRTRWIGADVEADFRAFTALPLAEAIEAVLVDVGPLREVELTVILKDRGYRPHRTDRQVYASVRQTLARYPRRFRQDGEERWSVVS